MVSRNRVDGLVIIPFRALTGSVYMNIETSTRIRVILNMDNKSPEVKLDMDTLLNNDSECDTQIQEAINYLQN